MRLHQPLICAKGASKTHVATYTLRYKNIRYIDRYIFDIFDINDFRYDIGDDQYIIFEPIYRRNIKSVAHTCVNLIFLIKYQRYIGIYQRYI